MDPEADLGDGKLSAEVGMRRRSASISDDYSVQKTNDDATECKYTAAKASTKKLIYVAAQVDKKYCPSFVPFCFIEFL